MEAYVIIRTTMKEFDSVDDLTVKAFIELAKPMISKKRFGELYEQALALLAAHRMKMEGLGTQSGAGTIQDTYGLSSVTEGGTSVSFATNQSDYSANAEYAMTIYGRQYLTIRKRVIVPIISAGEAK